MDGVLLAESAILLHLETIRVILLVLHGVVVSLLALRASQSDFDAHVRHLLNFASLPQPGREIELPRKEKGKKNKPFFTGEAIIP